MGAEAMLSTPAPGTLGHRLAVADVIDLRDVDTAHLLAEHQALASRYKTDLRDALAVIAELTELVVGAHAIITEAALDYTDWVPAEAWLDAADPIVGEAT